MTEGNVDIIRLLRYGKADEQWPRFVAICRNAGIDADLAFLALETKLGRMLKALGVPTGLARR